MADQIFHHFQITLCNSDRGRYETIRVRIISHPEEPLHKIGAKALAYCLEFNDGLSLSAPPYAKGQPALWRRDLTDRYLEWIEVGETQTEELARAVRHHRDARFVVYFYQPDQASKFAEGLRGSTENWIKQVEFFLLDSHLIDAIPEAQGKRAQWDATIVDQGIYLTSGEATVHGNVKRIDMWGIYQEALQKAADPELSGP